jgi:hypothetical protein
MAKMASFRPNHKIFSDFVARSELKKKKSSQKYLEKINFNEKVFFQPNLMYTIDTTNNSFF